MLTSSRWAPDPANRGGSAPTVDDSRELPNRGRHVGYKPSHAQEQTRARRWSGSRPEREPDLHRAVLERLANGWSPSRSLAASPAKPGAT